MPHFNFLNMGFMRLFSVGNPARMTFLEFFRTLAAEIFMCWLLLEEQLCLFVLLLEVDFLLVLSENYLLVVLTCEE
jgi:hypothetical protein